MKKHTMFVIFAGPQQHGAPGTLYFSKDGSTTDLRSKAARFYTFGDAKRFAQQKGITLDAVRYIGQAEFTDFEMQE